MSIPRVLINGAGPTGLVAALALLQNGIPVRIIEKLTTHRVGSKGCGIQPRTLELYNLLGVLPDLLSKSSNRFWRRLHLANGQTSDQELMNHLDDTPDRPYNNPVIIGQDRHEDILHEHLGKKYGCYVELGVELVSFEQTTDTVTARLIHHNDNDTEEIFETPYLVGCDGARSTIRKQLGVSFLSQGKLEGSMAAGDIYIKSPLDYEFWHMWGDRVNKMASLRPFETKDGRFNFVLAGSQVDTHAASQNRDSFIKAFVEVSGRSDIEFGDLICISYYQPNVRMVDTFSSGRVFIAGDAAHVHSPVGGQGLNTSVQDAVNLAWKLALVLKKHSPETILSSYSSERLPVVAAMLNITLNLADKVFGGAENDKLITLSRDTILRQFGVNYRGSDIVVDDFNIEGEVSDPYRSGMDGMVRGGDRAPDAPGLKRLPNGETTSLFGSVFGVAHHTLLVFGDAAPSLHYPANLVKTVLILPQGGGLPPGVLVEDVNTVLHDTQGHAYRNYEVSARLVQYVVVRPDGFIGALAKNEDSVERYFNRIFL